MACHTSAAARQGNFPASSQYEAGDEREEINLQDDPNFREKIQELTGGRTVPQIVISGTPIGGYDDLRRLDSTGELDKLLAA